MSLILSQTVPLKTPVTIIYNPASKIRKTTVVCFLKYASFPICVWIHDKTHVKVKDDFQFSLSTVGSAGQIQVVRFA